VAGEESLARDQVLADPSQSLRYEQIISGVLTPSARLPKFDGADTAVIKVRMVRNDDAFAPGIDLVVDRSSYSEFAQGSGGKAFGSYLDSQLAAHYDSSGPIGTLLRTLDATVSSNAVAARLRAVNPGDAYASLYTVGVRRANAVGIPLEDRLDAFGLTAAGDTPVKLAAAVGNGTAPTASSSLPNDDKNWTAWTAGHASQFRIDPNSTYGGTDFNDNGASLGVEHRIGNIRIGAIASIGQGRSNFENPSVRVESDHWHAGGYASVSFGAVTVDASGLFGASDESSQRAVTGGQANAKFESNDAQLGIGVTVNLVSNDGAWQVTPIARFKYVSYRQDAFSETGPANTLLFQSADLSEDTVISKLGLRVAHRSQISKSLSLGLDGAAYWVHDFNSEGRNLSMQVIGGNGNFRALGREGRADIAQLNLGLQAVVSEVVSFRLSGQQEIGSNRNQLTGVFAMGWSF
jgi:outer membrane autotransporter protein